MFLILSAPGETHEPAVHVCLHIMTVLCKCGEWFRGANGPVLNLAHTMPRNRTYVLIWLFPFVQGSGHNGPITPAQAHCPAFPLDHSLSLYATLSGSDAFRQQ